MDKPKFSDPTKQNILAMPDVNAKSLVRPVKKNQLNESWTEHNQITSDQIRI